MSKENFETLIEQSKKALNQLNQEELSLQKSLEIYKDGLKNLKKAQELLERAKLEYSHLENQEDSV